MLSGVKRDYRAVSYALISGVVGVIFMRIVMYFLPLPSDTYAQDLGVTAMFTLITQLVFFLAVPFCIYKFYGKRTVRQTLEYSSCTKFKPYFLFAIPLGICVYILALGLSTVWALLLEATGYTYASSSPAMPEQFSGGLFVAELLLSAIIPAVCEEFIMRGGMLTTARRTFGTIGCVVFCGIAFGLFHQNVKQVFYTMLFGALAAYLTIKMKSIYPAMLMHFTNNACSVYFSYAENYGFGGGNVFSILEKLTGNKFWAVALIFVALAVCAAALVVVMLYFREKRVIDKKKEVLKDSAFDATNKRVVLMGEFDPARVADLEMEAEVYGAGYKEEKYKPTLRDVMIIISVGVVAVLTTVFSYVWGFFY